MAEAPKSSGGSFFQKKVAGIPVPILAVGGGVLAVIIYRKYKSSSASSTTSATPATTDTTGTGTTSSGDNGYGGGYGGGGGGGPSGILAAIQALTSSINANQATLNAIQKQTATKTAPAKPVSTKPTAIPSAVNTNLKRTGKPGTPIYQHPGTGVRGSGFKNTSF